MEKIRNRLNNEQEKIVIDLYKQVQSIAIVAKQLNYSVKLVHNTLKRNNIPRRTEFSKRVTEEQRLEIVKLYQAGYTTPKIGEILGFAGKSVQDVLKKYNFNLKDKNPRKKLNKQQEQEVISLYNSENSTPKIANILNVSESLILITLKKYGVERRNLQDYVRNIENENTNEIINLYLDGNTTTVIGNKFNVNRSTIRGILKRNNIGIRPPNADKRKFNDKQEHEIIDLYNQGLSSYEIGEKYFVASGTIIRVLKDNNIKIRETKDYSKLNKNQELEIIKLYQDGLTSTKIGKQYDISKTLVIDVLYRNDIPVRTSHDSRRKLSKKQELEVIELYKQGLPISKICTRYNVSSQPIKSILKKYGIEIVSVSYYLKKEFTKDEELEVIEFYKGGLSAYKITKKLKVSGHLIHRILTANNIKIKTASDYWKKLTEKQEQEVINFYQQGCTIISLSETYKVSASLITRILKQNNITIRKVADYKKLAMNQELAIIKLYQEGISISKLAKLFKTKVSSIKEFIYTQNITKEKKIKILDRKSIDEAVNLYIQGFSIIRISKIFNTTYQKVHESINKKVNLRKNDITRTKLSKEEKAEVMSLYAREYTIEQIAEALLVSYTLIEQTISETHSK